MATVSFYRRSEEWAVRGVERRTGMNGELLLVEEDLSRIPVVDLRNALEKQRRLYPTNESAASVSMLPEKYFDADGPVGPIGFVAVQGQLLVTVDCYVEWPESGDEQEAVRDVRRLLAPVLDSRRSTLELIEVNEAWSNSIELGLSMRLGMPWRGKLVSDLFKQAEDVIRLIDTFASRAITRQTVADLVRGGASHLLLGQPEGNWLDAKAEEYDLSTPKGRISLAQAAARFANAEEGGLVLIGAKAKKVPGGEIIRQVLGVVPRQADTVARYTRVLDQHLYPAVLGLRINVVGTQDRKAVILIDIPSQPEELKPFLVHGAITPDGDVEGAFISIVQRRGEGSIPITAPMIHASIAAGRALLRGRRPESGSN